MSIFELNYMPTLFTKLFKLSEIDISYFRSVRLELQSITEILTLTDDDLKSESLILRGLYYKFKNQWRAEKVLKNIRQVLKAWERFESMELCKTLTNLKDLVPSKFPTDIDAVYLPSRRSVIFVIKHLIATSILLRDVCNLCVEACRNIQLQISTGLFVMYMSFCFASLSKFRFLCHTSELTLINCFKVIITCMPKLKSETNSEYQYVEQLKGINLLETSDLSNLNIDIKDAYNSDDISIIHNFLKMHNFQTNYLSSINSNFPLLEDTPRDLTDNTETLPQIKRKKIKRISKKSENDSPIKDDILDSPIKDEILDSPVKDDIVETTNNKKRLAKKSKLKNSVNRKLKKGILDSTIKDDLVEKTNDKKRLAKKSKLKKLVNRESKKTIDDLKSNNTYIRSDTINKYLKIIKSKDLKDREKNNIKFGMISKKEQVNLKKKLLKCKTIDNAIKILYRFKASRQEENFRSLRTSLTNLLKIKNIYNVTKFKTNAKSRKLLRSSDEDFNDCTSIKKKNGEMKLNAEIYVEDGKLDEKILIDDYDDDNEENVENKQFSKSWECKNNEVVRNEKLLGGKELVWAKKIVNYFIDKNSLNRI